MSPQLISGDISRIDPQGFRTSLQENNVTRIDTAALYENGESEKILGRFDFPRDFTIDTKILFTTLTDATLSPSAIEKSLNNSLQALGVDQVNVLYCHGPDFNTPIAEQAKAFHEHYKAGKFKYLGVSNFQPDMLQEWLEIAEKEGYVKPSWFQGQYNLLCRSHEENLFPLLRKNNIHYAAYSPLAGGFLLGNFTQEGIQSGIRFGSATPFKNWYDHQSMHDAVKKLRGIAERTGIGMGELSIRWLRYHSVLEDGDVVIVGGSKIEHVGPSIQQAKKGPLPDEVAKDLSAFWEGVREDGQFITDLTKIKF